MKLILEEFVLLLSIYLFLAENLVISTKWLLFEKWINNSRPHQGFTSILWSDVQQRVCGWSAWAHVLQSRSAADCAVFYAKINMPTLKHRSFYFQWACRQHHNRICSTSKSDCHSWRKEQFQVNPVPPSQTRLTSSYCTLTYSGSMLNCVLLASFQACEKVV